MKYVHKLQYELIPELKASGSFFSCSALSLFCVVYVCEVVFFSSVVLFTLVEEDTGLVVIVTVDVILVVTTADVLPSVVFFEVRLAEEDVAGVVFSEVRLTEEDVAGVVFSEVRLTEEDVAGVSVTKLVEIVVDALVALLTTVVSSVSEEVV